MSGQQGLHGHAVQGLSYRLPQTIHKPVSLLDVKMNIRARSTAYVVRGLAFEIKKQWHGSSLL